MRIEIAERLRPFSHLPGTTFVLPASSLGVVVFPCLIRFHDLTGSIPIVLGEIALDLEGPIDDFTALLDLENGKLKVWGKSAKGYFRYTIKALEHVLGVAVLLEKAPQDELIIKCRGRLSSEETSITLGNEVVISERIFNANTVSFDFLQEMERLSLGNHKLQDWELVRRRCSFTEIFPIWHRLGMILSSQFKDATGTALLLEVCQRAIAGNAPEKILKTFRHLFLAGFEGVLTPRLVDTDFHGIKYQDQTLSDVSEVQGTALILLTQGAKLIRSLFIQDHTQGVLVLPALPPEFHCGRLLQARCGKQGVLSFEWSKKSVRRMTFSASESQQIAFFFFDHETKCRLRNSYKDKGIAYIPGSQIEVIAGQHYWFDNFQR